MSTYNVNAEGKRIQTDILIEGYIRDFSKENKLLIPDDITQICYAFWFIKVTDEWDRKYSAQYIVEINGQTAETKAKRMISLYGTLGVDKGSYSWKLKLKSDVKWMNIGFIEDNSDILKENQYSNNYIAGPGGCLSAGGYLYGAKVFDMKSFSSYLPDEDVAVFSKSDTEITMTLDIDNNTVQYRINDTDYEVIHIKLAKSKYRLIVNFQHKDNKIELL